MNKYPCKNLSRDPSHRNKKLSKKSSSYISSVASWIMKIYLCFLKTGYNIYNIRKLMWRLRRIYIMPTVRQNMFSLRNISRVGIPKSTVLIIIFRVFMWPLSLIIEVPIIIIHLQCLEMVYQKDNIIL